MDISALEEVSTYIEEILNKPLMFVRGNPALEDSLLTAFQIWSILLHYPERTVYNLHRVEVQKAFPNVGSYSTTGLSQQSRGESDSNVRERIQKHMGAIWLQLKHGAIDDEKI